MRKEFGGYLPLELNARKREYYQKTGEFDVIRFNNGRATFFHAAKEQKMKKIFLPYFTCPETESPFVALNVEVEYYFLTDQLTPKNIKPNDNEYIFWTNYYGNASEVEKAFMVKNYKNLIIDNCQAFFSPPLEGAFNCYSTRKFFGVSDGAYLIKDNFCLSTTVAKDTSYANAVHLIKQWDTGINSGYPDNLCNENRLSNNYKAMSRFTQKLLETIDYKKVKKKRRENFLTLHEILSKKNEFPINLMSETHMYYPFLIEQENLRYKLINDKVFNPFWWEHVLDLVPKSSIEYRLAKYTVMLPIDQRYSTNDIIEIGNIVKSNICE